MLIFTKIADLQQHLDQIRAQNKTIGFVPTMGALHEGHLSLIKASKQACDHTVCSIFVNPTQFNDASDLEKYPRMPEKDTKLLQHADCDALFMPLVEEMYAKNEKTADFNFGELDKILEGKSRPGHFKGVAQVVKRFFEIIQPDRAFFGGKDYQQVLIVKALVKQMNSGIEIITCPILRDPDGLAMSSRNTLLNEEERISAGAMAQIMQKVKPIIKTADVETAKEFVSAEIMKIPHTTLDYFEICDADTLKILTDKSTADKTVALIAVFVGKIRLIDNFIVN